jgi:tetratricopeptide (TPR) repeat protein
MMAASNLDELAEQGKREFAAARYEAAVERFRLAAEGFAEINDELNAAEQMNNLSVALLKLGRPQDALNAVLRTDEVFAGTGDVRRQGMAVNNQAAALQGLERIEEALAAYERSASLLQEAGEGELRAVVLKAAAAIQLRRGKIAESGMRMIGALEARKKPSLFERLLKLLLRLNR